ncbi:MAG: hypothetical protein R2991_07055 [Thermoanaerobaculia bacterium]
MRRAVRVLAYAWAAPTSAIGLLVALPVLIANGRWHFVGGVLEVHGPLLEWALRRWVPLPGGAQAMTLGHVVLGRDGACLARSRIHERIHVAQCERWGPFFLPAYGVASLVGWWRHGDAYRGNAFEQAAWEGERPRSLAG